MKLGNKTIFLLGLIFFNLSLIAEEKIVTSPLINLDELKPSFEEIDNSSETLSNREKLKNKKISAPKNNIPSAKFIGLDKITAKTSEIIINLGEKKNFGPLEIKVLKCSLVSSNNAKDSVAYVQVKDLSKNDNEKIFIFNGWTFSSDPTVAPFDHAIYDLQLLNCINV